MRAAARRSTQLLLRRPLGTTIPPAPPIKPLPLGLEPVTGRASIGSSLFGAVVALGLGLAIVDEVMNVVVAVHSARWDSVEGEIVGAAPEVASSGAMLKRPEVGVRYKYFVEPGPDDEDKDEPGAGHFESCAVYAAPRKGLLTSLPDFLKGHDAHHATHFAHALARNFPAGAKVRVYYNAEAPDRSCLIRGLPYPDGPLRLPFYMLGTPVLMAVARSSLPIPVRFAFFTLGILVWTEVSEDAETILFDYTRIGEGYTARKLK